METQKIPIAYKDGLLVVKSEITGKNGKRKIKCAIDTACSVTTVRTDIIDSLGYSARDGENLSFAVSSTGKEMGYMLKVKDFQVNEIKFDNFLIDAVDMPDDVGIECLIGNNFLERFIIEIDYQNEILTIR